MNNPEQGVWVPTEEPWGEGITYTRPGPYQRIGERIEFKIIVRANEQVGE